MANKMQGFFVFMGIVAVLLLCLVGFMVYNTNQTSQTMLQTTAPSTAQTVSGSSGECTAALAGKAATVYINGYNKESYSNSEVYSVYYVTDSANNYLVDNANANSTNTIVCEPLNFYGGGTTYYTTAKLAWKVPNEAPAINLDVHAISAESSMGVTGYDKNKNALTADDDAENDADYGAFTLGANQEEILYVDLQNKDDQSLFQVKAICLFWNGNISELTVENSDWTEVAMPKQIRDTTVTVNNDTSTGAPDTASVDYDTCYVYKAGTSDVIALHEWQSISDVTGNLLKLKVTAGTSDPIANAFDEFGGIFLDASHDKGEDNIVHFDYYTHDNNQYVNTVGMAETYNSPEGLQIGFLIEAA